MNRREIIVWGDCCKVIVRSSNKEISKIFVL